jgi:hypothetical protein
LGDTKPPGQSTVNELAVLAADRKAKPPSMQVAMIPLLADCVIAVVSKQGELAKQAVPDPAGEAHSCARAGDDNEATKASSAIKQIS